MAVKKIYTDGYRGALTGGSYLPPGEYTIGAALDIAARVVPEELARYMVSIGKAVGRADFEDADEVATKVVNVVDGAIEAQPRSVKRTRGKRTGK